MLQTLVVLLHGCDAQRAAVLPEDGADAGGAATDTPSPDASAPPPAAGPPGGWELCGSLGEGPITAAAYSPDATSVALAYRSGLITLHDASDGRVLSELRGGPRSANADLAFARGGALLGARLAGEVVFWERTVTGSWSATARFASSTSILAVSPDGQLWAEALTGRAVVRRVSDGSVVTTVPGEVHVAAFTESNALVTSGQDRPGLEVFDQSGALLRRVPTPATTAAALSANGRWAFLRWSEQDRAQAALWDVDAGARVWRHEDDAAVGPSDRISVGSAGHVVALRLDGVRVLRPEDGTLLRYLPDAREGDGADLGVRTGPGLQV